MKNWELKTVAITALLFAPAAFAQSKPKLGQNAALRYYAAFSVMQDAALSDQEAKELTAILDGSAPYDDTKYKSLVERNNLALKVMARGAELPNCDWGLDYELGDEIPVEYTRKALQLGRLNVLNAFHLALVGDKDGAVHALTAGLHFSHDVANGGSLFSTVIAKELLMEHFHAIEGLQHLGGISSARRAVLRKALAQLGGEGLDWESGMKMEMAVLNRPDWQKDVPLGQVAEAYINALRNPSTLPQLEELLSKVPVPLREVIPSPKEVIGQKQEFEAKLQGLRAMLR
jgi:hypothetical protein